MKCNHPGCFASITEFTAVFPPVSEMEKALKLNYGQLKECHLNQFGRHPVHGPGITYEETITFMRTTYRSPITLTVPPKPAKHEPVTEKKPAIEQLTFQALSQNNGKLSMEGALKAAAKARRLDIPVEKAVHDFARGERLAASNRAKKSVARPTA